MLKNNNAKVFTFFQQKSKSQFYLYGPQTKTMPRATLLLTFINQAIQFKIKIKHLLKENEIHLFMEFGFRGEKSETYEVIFSLNFFFKMRYPSKKSSYEYLRLYFPAGKLCDYILVFIDTVLSRKRYKVK